MHYTFNPKGVCSMEINFDIDDQDRITNVEFLGGCHGNLQAISKLVDGMTVDQINEKLKGNDCRGRGTSCADQFAIACSMAKLARDSK